ncbi:MAG: twitching motility protein PilT [Nitrospirae bacterium RBG_16_64_22]|nr:MAG: twitching motility protein PilT [Nitrospirae bacterium RBG_16_64_22]
MIVVDASVWIDYFNGRSTPQTDRLDDLLGLEPILTGDIVLTEVLQGFKHERDFREALKLLSLFEFREMMGRDIAVASALNYRLLRAKGVTPRTVDMVIGTFCIENGHCLLHADADFDPMERYLGLDVVR